MQSSDVRIALMKSAARSRGFLVKFDPTSGRWQVIVPAPGKKGKPVSGENDATVYSFSLAEAEAFVSRDSDGIHAP